VSTRARGAAGPAATLTVLAKRPIVGQVKTRLGGALAPDVIVGLYAAMLEDTLRAGAEAAAALGLELAWAAPPEPGSADPLGEARAWCAARGLDPRVEAQAGGPLGARIRAALEGGLARAPAAIVVGADAPGLGRPRIEAALAALAAEGAFGPGPRAVWGPTGDGGFDLLAVDHAPLWLDAPIRWSTADAGADTVRAADAAGVRVRALDVGWDVDTPDDLPRLAAALAAWPPHVARAVRAWRARFGAAEDPLSGPPQREM
jgi:hypothetical protein